LDAADWKYAFITAELGLIIRQVKYACNIKPTPQNHYSGTYPLIDDISQQILIDFVCASRRNCRIPYLEIFLAFNLNVSALAVQNLLERTDFYRYIARRKPYIFEKNCILRLAWA